AAADRQAPLVVGYNHFDPGFVLVDHHAADRGGLERVDHESRGVLVPRDGGGRLALQFRHHRLDAAALRADAGADRVDRAVIGNHADLGAAARIAGGGLDLDDPVVDFGHFLREQLLHEFWVRAAEEDLRAAIVALDLHDQRADPLAHPGGFARDLLVAADNALGAAEIDDHVAEFDRLDHPGDHFAGAVLEFLVLALTLGIAHLLEDHLLGALRVDPAEIDRGQRIDDEIAQRGIGIE